jgi:hemolysin activation/secretion protein
VNGIRAYKSTDGVGDQGAQMSFDIIHQVVPDVYGGLFYDVGVVKNSHTPSSTATDTGAYLLQGVGWQVGGKINEFNWSLSVAHAFGKTPGPGVWLSTNTQPGDVRGNFAITRSF